jgi:hypothetical protein
MFNLFQYDIIVKIFDIRCNDIEIDILKLEKKINNIEIITKDLIIKDNNIYFEKIQILKGNIIYVGDKYLYDIIYPGLVIFVYTELLYNSTTSENMYMSIKSKIYDHPTSLIHMCFLINCTSKFNINIFLESNILLTKELLKKYNIKPDKRICYIEGKLCC